jgi:hypothetical protein
MPMHDGATRPALARTNAVYIVAFGEFASRSCFGNVYIENDRDREKNWTPDIKNPSHYVFSFEDFLSKLRFEFKRTRLRPKTITCNESAQL